MTPIVLIALAMILISSTVGAIWIWVIVGVLVVALIVLIAVLVRNGMFVGPGVVIEDARTSIQKAVGFHDRNGIDDDVGPRHADDATNPEKDLS